MKLIYFLGIKSQSNPRDPQMQRRNLKARIEEAPSPPAPPFLFPYETCLYIQYARPARAERLLPQFNSRYSGVPRDANGNRVLLSDAAAGVKMYVFAEHLLLEMFKICRSIDALMFEHFQHRYYIFSILYESTVTTLDLSAPIYHAPKIGSSARNSDLTSR